MPLLSIKVRFHDARYHGAGAWPPAPARLFQALVAAAARGATIPASELAALKWLEALHDAPEILAPVEHRGQSFYKYMPNNDLDAVGGNPARLAEIKGAEKHIWPRLLPQNATVSFRWLVPEGSETDRQTAAIGAICARLYQFGRGIDMAWAQADLVAGDDPPEVGSAAAGCLWRPGHGPGGVGLDCPKPGSLKSLQDRFATGCKRFERKGKSVILHNPPPPRFRSVVYASPTIRYSFEIRCPLGDHSFAPYLLQHALDLVSWARDAAAARLRDAIPAQSTAIDRVFIGSKAATSVDKTERLRILPLPSIGHPEADLQIRRLLVEIPAQCPLDPEDVRWAFSGLENTGDATGEILRTFVATGNDFLDAHFAPAGARVWRTLTPAALPFRSLPQRASGIEREQRDGELAAAAAQALRHAGVIPRPQRIQVQKEPFDKHGAPAPGFSAGRFGAARLHHVQITFPDPVIGPLAIGDGRYLGLGVMAPVQHSFRDLLCFAIPPSAAENGPALLHAVRRALMALARDGQGNIARLFSGHEADGSPSSPGGHAHVFLAVAPPTPARPPLLVIAAPWRADRTCSPSDRDRGQFEQIVTSLDELRAGCLGVLHLPVAQQPETPDPLLGPSRWWRSQTSFRATRHGRRGRQAQDVAAEDLAAECRRRGLPEPLVEIVSANAGPRGGNVVAHATLRFAVAVEGPIMLGRDSHAGGGLFLASEN